MINNIPIRIAGSLYKSISNHLEVSVSLAIRKLQVEYFAYESIESCNKKGDRTIHYSYKKLIFFVNIAVYFTHFPKLPTSILWPTTLRSESIFIFGNELFLSVTIYKALAELIWNDVTRKNYQKRMMSMLTLLWEHRGALTQKPIALSAAKNSILYLIMLDLKSFWMPSIASVVIWQPNRKYFTSGDINA